MAAGWMRRDSGDDGTTKDPVIEIKPEQIRDAVKGDFDAINTSLSAVTAYIAEQREARAEAERQASERARASAKTDEDNSVDWLTDPQAAMRREMRPLAESNAAMAAMLMRREILEGKDYYKADPAFTAEVDKMIDAQPLNLRSNPAIIMNCYKSVHYDFLEKIKEGKVKSSMSMNSGGGSNGGSDKGGDNDGERSVTLTADEKHYARKMGVSEADWVKQKKELEYV